MINRLPEPFLREIARQYVDNELDSLPEFCFVTPNKRTATFLTKYFKELISAADYCGLAPDILPITDFIGEFSESVEASVFELLFILYNVYSEILQRHATPEMIESGANLVDFNKFQYWGGVLISDFNDVDKYLVDPHQLFRNVATLKEISANYLTPEQIEVIKKYWREEDIPQPAKEFWNHVTYKSGRDCDEKRSTSGFVKLWQVMEELYIEFKNVLRDKGLAYSGMMYRDVCDFMKEASPEDFPYKRYVFVGFNVLSVSEKTIFSRLQKLGIADFYWDYASPTFDIVSSTATRFLKKQVKEFPSRYKAGQRLDSYPEVEIIAMPSAIGQTQVMPEVIRGLHPEIFLPDGSVNPGVSQHKLFNTAIVLPDEKLCVPLLNSLPDGLTNLNVTMGFSVRNAPVYSLFRNIVSMQLRARLLKYDNTFFYEDVIAVLSHPLIRLASAEACDSIIDMINRRRLFNIPISELNKEKYASLSHVFKVVNNVSDSSAVIGYLYELIEWLESLVIKARNDEFSSPADDKSIEGTDHNSPVDSQSRQLPPVEPERDNNSLEENDSELDEEQLRRKSIYSLERGFLTAYRDALAELARLDRVYLLGKNMFLADKTVFHLVERILGHKTIQFEGVPLRGLQIMGVLEVRNLDFENIVIMSMNERIFPRRHYSKSMIPNALRKAYSMATLEHQESIYSYYFYRMISRARKVVLMYDGRNIGAKSGQPSRYINQVRFIFPYDKMIYSPTSYSLTPPVIDSSGVPKSPAIIAKLNRYVSETSPRYLSASSINAYINCPLQFYLQNVEQFYEVDELKDYMDDSTYGTIVHETIQWIYEAEQARLGVEILDVDEPMLARLSTDRNIGYHLARSIKKNYLRWGEDDPRPLFGDSELFFRIMTRQIRYMFTKEVNLLPFSFKSAEAGRSMRFRISDSLTVNLTYRIDRVDVIKSSDESFIRLIDYKTGSDTNKAGSIAELFNSETESRNKALLQLLLYSNAYAQDENYGGRIEPMLYSLRRIAIDDITPFTLPAPKDAKSRSRYEITDYREFNDEFMSYLEHIVKEMLNPDIPFVAKPERHHCKYCQFQDICGKGIKSRILLA